MKDRTYFITSAAAIVVGIAAIGLGIISSQNIKNELKFTRNDLKITSKRSDLLTRVAHIEDYQNKYLITLARTFMLIETASDFKLTDEGRDVLKDINAIPYLGKIYMIQPQISTKFLIVHILSEDQLPREVECWNSNKGKKGETPIPLEAVLGTIMVYHETVHLKKE